MKEKIKNSIKESSSGIIISLCLSFMLLFYEPLNIFASNLNDFWFDLYLIFPIVLLQFIVSFLILSLFFIVIKKINQKIYIFFVVCFLIGTLCSYVQGNFLIGSLPAIDGTWINFDTFKTEKMISLILWIIVSGSVIFCLVKFKFKMVENVAKYSSYIIMAMLFCSMLSFLTVDGFLVHKSSVVATYKGYNEMSEDKNFIIFLLDAVDSVTFKDEVARLSKTDTLLEDFTYYPDTLGGYPFTQNSIPLILTGKWYENEELFSKFYTKAYDESPLFKKLEEENYSINLYEDDLNGYSGSNYERFTNVERLKKVNVLEFLEEESKIILYKYLPYQLKWRASIGSLNFADSKGTTKNEVYTRYDIPNYEKYKNDKITKTSGNNFKFIHLEGAHNPKRYDINLNIVEKGSYLGNIDASITVLETYLKRLKDNGVYDNSVIVIMSDHGFKEVAYGRQNPILYIKGINEKHKYKVSSNKVSYGDLYTAFSQLIDGDKSDKLFTNTQDKERRYIFYEYNDAKHMREQTQVGKASNPKTLKDTGKKYEKH